MIQIGSASVQDFLKKLPRAHRGPFFQAVQDCINFAERTGKPGHLKKKLVKDLLKQIVDIPSIPDWIEDVAIDIIIDVLASVIFPADTATTRRQMTGH